MVGELDEENLNLALSTDVSLGKKKKVNIALICTDKILEWIYYLPSILIVHGVYIYIYIYIFTFGKLHLENISDNRRAPGRMKRMMGYYLKIMVASSEVNGWWWVLKRCQTKHD